MAGDINRVTLVGRLTRDPEVQHLPSGTAVLRLGLAVNGRQQDAGGNWVDKPNFFDVKVFGNQAEMLSQHLAKGRRIGVDGRLDWSSWEQDGAKRSKVEVIAQSVQFLDSRSDGEGGGSSGSYLPPQAAGQPGGSGGGSDADFPATPADDDIPF
jgi:single-strand DNA-binding protein